jgi:hypothetical protein
MQAIVVCGYLAVVCDTVTLDYVALLKIVICD